MQPETQEKKLRTRDRSIFGIILPVLVLIAAMLVIANVDSRAGAAEFAGLGVFRSLEQTDLIQLREIMSGKKES